MKYNSPPTSVDQQIILIRSRGMLIHDELKAKTFLQSAGYSRFTGYALYFERFEDRKRTHLFKEGASFDEVTGLYNFDSGLRSVLFDAIGDIEIAFRSQLCSVLSLRTGDPHWPLNSDHFVNWFEHERFLEEIRRETDRSRELFIQNYKKKYSSPELPAA